MPLADGEIIFKGAQRVSIISPSILPVPWMKFDVYWTKQLS
jgi:hypothetical protein